MGQSARPGMACSSKSCSALDCATYRRSAAPCGSSARKRPVVFVAFFYLRSHLTQPTGFSIFFRDIFVHGYFGTFLSFSVPLFLRATSRCVSWLLFFSRLILLVR